LSAKKLGEILQQITKTGKYFCTPKRLHNTSVSDIICQALYPINILEFQNFNL